LNSANPGQNPHDRLTSGIHQERPDTLNPAKRYLDGITNLPPAPTLVTEWLGLFQKPDCTIDQIVRIIRYDPSLTAHILRNSNSAIFAGEKPVADIFEAVSRMGFFSVYCLAASFFGVKTKHIEGAEKGINVDALWHHHVAAAVSASVVAEESGMSPPVAFTAGLLHDIGKLVFASAKGESYAKLIQSAIDQRVLLSALEHSALIIDHAELGGELMRRWNLPPEVVAAVRDHHKPAGEPPHEKLTAAVQAGDMIGHQLFAEDLAGTDLLAPSTAALATLQLSPDSLPRLLARAQAEMEKVKVMLEM